MDVKAMDEEREIKREKEQMLQMEGEEALDCFPSLHPSKGMTDSMLLQELYEDGGGYFMEESFEEILVGNDAVDLPSGLCENKGVLDAFLSMDTWKLLSESLRGRLEKHLPSFPGLEPDQEAAERQRTLTMLFGGENFHFGNPVETFKNRLTGGQLAPETAKMDAMLRKIFQRQFREKQRERQLLILQDVLTSRKKLLESRTGEPARTPMAVIKMEKKSVRARPDLEFKIGKRYFKELNMIHREVGAEEVASDELYPNGPPEKSSRRDINLLESDYWKSVGETACFTSLSHHLEERKDGGQSLLNKKTPAQLDPRANLGGASKLHRLHQVREPLDIPDQSLPLPWVPAPPKPKVKSVNDLRVVEEAVANIPGMSPTKEEDSLDELTAGLDWGATTAKAPAKHERPSLLDREYFACYFSLLRDKFRGNPDYKITIPTLEEVVQDWQDEEEGGDRCDWRHQVDDWREQIPSAVAFLTGAFPDAQPRDFHPFVDCDPVAGTYQWIGTGRDSDVNLGALTQWWFSRRDKCRAVTTTTAAAAGSGDQNAPTAVDAAAECILQEFPLASSLNTSWTVRPSSEDDKAVFREQERCRFSAPGSAFTYSLHGYSSVVGPVRTGSTSSSTKVKSHPLLTTDRPSYVNVVALVKDAVARLPNGEGSRPDIVELMRDSQYLNEHALTEGTSLTNVVSGALDRLQNENDPCVKYDSNRRIWINLHRGRSEADFVQMAWEAQPAAVTKATQRPKKKTAATAASSVLEMAMTNVFRASPEPFISQEEAMKSAVQSILDNVSSTPAKSSPASPFSPHPSASSPPNRTTSVKLQQLPSPLAAAAMLPSTPLPMITSPSAAAAAAQTVQVMTSAGLKTFRLAGGAAAQNSVATGHQSPPVSLLAAKPDPQTLQQSLLTMHPNSILRLPSKPILPNAPTQRSTSELRQQVAAGPSNMQQSLSLRQQAAAGERIPMTMSSLMATMSNSPLLPSPARNLQPSFSHLLPQPATTQQVQRVIVKNADGNPVQLTQVQLQQLLSSGALKQSVQVQLPERPRDQQPPMSATAAVQQVLASVASSSPAVRPQTQFAPSMLRFPESAATLVARSQQVQGIRYLNLNPSGPTGNMTRLLSPGCSNPGQQQQQQPVRLIQAPGSSSVRLAPAAPASTAPQSLLLQQRPSAPSAVAIQQQQIRLSSPIAVGQRVSLGGKQYVLSLSATGQQILTPLAQQPPAQVVYNPRGLEGVRIGQQQVQELLGKQVVTRFQAPDGGDRK